MLFAIVGIETSQRQTSLSRRLTAVGEWLSEVLDENESDYHLVFAYVADDVAKEGDALLAHVRQVPFSVTVPAREIVGNVALNEFTQRMLGTHGKKVGVIVIASQTKADELRKTMCVLAEPLLEDTPSCIVFNPADPTTVTAVGAFGA